jgi:protein deglycase
VLHKIAREFNKQKKPITTLCVGVLPVSDAGLLKDKKATTYNLSRYHDNPGRLQKGGAIYTENKVEFDNNIISCAGPASSLDVAFKLVELLTGKENLEEVKKLMIA